MTDPTEQATIERARRGDPAALEALWLRHRGWVASVLRAHRPRGVEVEDLLQEVAIRFLRSIRGLDDPHAFGGWLRAIAVNVARSERRRVGRDPVVDEHALTLVPDLAGAARDAARERLAATLEALERLDVEQREVLLLKTVHGFSQARIATTLGASVAAVESRLARARRALRAALAAADHPPRLHLSKVEDGR